MYINTHTHTICLCIYKPPTLILFLSLNTHLSMRLSACNLDGHNLGICTAYFIIISRNRRLKATRQRCKRYTSGQIIVCNFNCRCHFVICTSRQIERAPFFAQNYDGDQARCGFGTEPGMTGHNRVLNTVPQSSAS